MILLSLGLIQEQLLSSRRRMDKIDHALLWIMKISLLVLFLTLPHALGVNGEEQNHDQQDDSEFFFHCSGGKLEEVQSALEQHPNWVNARTDNGETCLHLTGIYGATQVTELLLQKGADPNVRSTYEGGLRMHPLSWNVYGGHIDNIDLLLKHGADVNLDFDGMGEAGAVTALDVALQLVQNEKGDDRFTKLEKILRKHGAKTTEELKQQLAEEL